MKQKIFNIAIYSALIWSILSAVYVTLPLEYQEMLPAMNEGTAIIGGLMTFFTGTGGLAVAAYLRNTKQYTNDINKTTVDKFLLVIDEYNKLESNIKNVETKLDKNNELLAADLNSKLDNAMLTTTARELIEGALDVKKK